MSDLTDSATINQAINNAQYDALINLDFELNGTVNRAALEGQKFALIMAMLEQDYSHRPQVEQPNEPSQSVPFSENNNYYPKQPLSANDSYWQLSEYTQNYFHSGHIQTAQLWLAMHPEPLSQHNDANILNAEVVANCGLNTQTRLQQTPENRLKTDETQLYDILQTLEPDLTVDLEEVS